MYHCALCPWDSASESRIRSMTCFDWNPLVPRDAEKLWSIPEIHKATVLGSV